jgi:hypothetical protein
MVMDSNDAQRLYLEIAKGQSTPAEALNLRKCQSRAVKCSVVRGEPVYQVRELLHGGDCDQVKRSQLSGASHAASRHVFSMSSNPHTLPVSQAIRRHNAALADLYCQHRETVQQLRNALLTHILPNVIDELGLDNAARDWAKAWLQDDRTYSLSSRHSARRFLNFSLSVNCSVHIPHPEGENATAC